MSKYTPAVACLCGGAFVGNWIVPGWGALAGGLFGAWLGWPK